MPVKVAEVYRGKVLESTHMGSIAVVRWDGSVLYALGDHTRLTFFHSAAKPLQALAALEYGIAEKFGFDLKEIAIMASSHNGEKEHIGILERIMEKLGVGEQALKCGAHEPLGKEAARELRLSGKEPSRIHCNCSGKHLGFIAAAMAKGLGTEEYHRTDHSVQEDVKRVISEFSNVAKEDIEAATDGCGVPVYAVPLGNMALAYANLCNNNFMEGKYKKSQNYIVSAMTMFPDVIAGKGSFDTEIMASFGDRIVVKTGAEGVCCAGLPAKGVGLALKIEDGSKRAAEPVMLEILHQMKVIGKDELEKVEKFRRPEIKSHSGDKIGEVRAAFTL
jgi:L-asparaginase II